MCFFFTSNGAHLYLLLKDFILGLHVISKKKKHGVILNSLKFQSDFKNEIYSVATLFITRWFSSMN